MSFTSHIKMFELCNQTYWILLQIKQILKKVKISSKHWCTKPCFLLFFKVLKILFRIHHRLKISKLLNQNIRIWNSQILDPDRDPNCYIQIRNLIIIFRSGSLLLYSDPDPNCYIQIRILIVIHVFRSGS